MITRILKITAIALIIWVTSLKEVSAQITLPRLISNGMVLQRDIPIPVWGWAPAGETVKVSFNNKTYTVQSGVDNKWLLKLKPMKAGGPYAMNIDGSNHITITDILIGDVWVCSGQSNMELSIDRVKDRYKDAIARSANPNIRQFLVRAQYNFQTPQQDVKSTGWKSADPQNLLQFTAAGYFFARALYEKYKVPIGLINSTKGGTPAETWMSEDALKQFPNYYDQLPDLRDTMKVNQTIRNDRTASREWTMQMEAEEQGLKPGQPAWYNNSYNATDWAEMQIPNLWQDGPLKGVNGSVWFRKDIDVPQTIAGKDADLFMGNIVDIDSTYVNGVKVGYNSNRYMARKYVIPAGLLKAGENTITVRVINRSGAGGLVTDKPYKLMAGGDSINLAGTWKYKIGAAMKPLPGGTTFEYKPLGAYNAMIVPLLNYGIKGVIWYQGEANSSKAKEYQKLFPALITDWRNNWHSGNFPFLFVQLTSYGPTAIDPGRSHWAELREAQSMTLSLPNTGMAVTEDIGEWNDVHPTNKEDVGKRLALAAEKIAYHDNKIVYSGPVYQSMKIEGDKIIISFTNTGSGLMIKNGQQLQGFTIKSLNEPPG